MPRPRNPDGREPKSRSRNGCWSCKARKVKCTEERPSCSKCTKGGYRCDYGIRLNWDGRRSKRPQLKAIQIGAEDGLDPAFPGDSQPIDDDVDLDSPFQQFRFPPFQPDTVTTSATTAPSPPSTASSSESSAKTVGQRISFIPVHSVHSPPRKMARTASGKSAPRKTGADAISPPPSAAVFRFDVQTLSSVSSRKTPKTTKKALKAVAKDKSVDKSVDNPLDGSLASLDSMTSLANDSATSPTTQKTNPGQPRGTKRRRPESDVSETDFAWQWPMSPSIGSGSTQSITSPVQPTRTSVGTSAPPAAFLKDPDGYFYASAPLPRHAASLQPATDFRRLSVSSLLSSGPGLAATPPTTSSTPTALPLGTANDPLCTADAPEDSHSAHAALPAQHHGKSHSHFYGTDYGFRDLDIDANDDAQALSGSPVDKHHLPPSNRGQAPHEEETLHARAGYYSKPVPVRIPRALGTLPQKLTENPMNLLYFHHFINHTARVLVPHDDPQSNPFRTILPQLALSNDNLLSLMLAYSASHRAHVIGQEAPGMRIALWVQDIFPALRQALSDPKQKISNANVATAIMLASLAILAPSTFGYSIPWQTHLMLARQIIAARPEGLRVDRHSTLEGQVCSFLWSWFAYIDVLGGLSGGPTDASPAWILDFKVYDPQDDDEIDCIMGFTTRCVYVLSQIAELVRQCEPERLRLLSMQTSLPGAQGLYGKVDTHSGLWVPSDEVVMRVKSLVVDVRDSMVQRPRACAHVYRSGDVVRWDRREMEATNEAYHWAALVHLQRRVLGKPTDSPDVQDAVQHILSCISKVRFGGTAENCLLFPLFAAGCECRDPSQREQVMQRLVSVEGTAMMQVTSAMALMQKAWSLNRPWETLLTTEFVG